METRPSDADFVEMAIDLAAEGEGLVSPNPLVGTVIVRDGRIVGRGLHRYADRKHAEVVALEDAGELARGATVYVNLEPCSHFGRTSPCAEALVEAGVARVVASMQDPASYVDGRGFARLREAGIEVEVGPGRARAERLNERYVKYVATRRPFVLLKLACTLDGRVAARAGASEWITGEAARAASHELRRRYDAILVGASTAAVDDPSLTYRGGAPKRVPLVRCVVDGSLRLAPDGRLASSAGESPLVVYCRSLDSDAKLAERAAALRARGVEIVEAPDASGASALDLSKILDDLGARKVSGLIVEGGPETAARFLDAALVDKVTFFVAPKILGGRDAVGVIGGDRRASIAQAIRLTGVEVTNLGEDLEITGYPAAGPAAPAP